MDRHIDVEPQQAPVFRIDAPRPQCLPLVLASPHSGRDYPPEFLEAARLEGAALRKSEDCFVDEIFARAAGCGAPLIAALFPRAYVDPNREAFELDPDMFSDGVPAYVNSRSPRVAAGLGTIARVVASGEEIYRRKLQFAEALARVNACYRPYHAALAEMIEATRARFGHCVLIDCHSMPSAGVPEAPGGGRVDIVLGDCYGSSCDAAVIDAAELLLKRLGYQVSRNSPYAGGFTTRHYGRPRERVHALQIEISRALYMDEQALERKPFLQTLGRHMELLVTELGRLPAATLWRSQS
jgi:N-formylglutamate amidohydrolase